MKTADIKKIRKKMEKMLDAKRFEHTLGVAYTASALAMRYNEDISRALTAGLLHDCAKCISNEKKIAICEKHNIPINEVERENPFLLHAKVGSYMAMKQFNIHDQDVINAILNHTTGRPGMSQLEKIIYVADYIEPGRRQAPNLQQIRKEVFQDLDRAMLLGLEMSIEGLEKRGVAVNSYSVRARDHLKGKLSDHEKRQA